MNKKYIIAIIFFSAVLFISACTNAQNKSVDVEVTLGQESFAKKSSDSTVSIDLEPHQYEDGVLDIDIYLNTHSVEMSQFDLKKQVKLVINDQEYYPVDAPTLSGHHNSGTLRFEIPEKPDKHKIIIIGIPDIEERIFEWP